ncbi:MAG: nucleotidyltransferase domain-containing protein [Clostridium sp.]|nr:nucleotidyltransferase domain-containing protein [Clostridium sp.]
MEPKEVQKYMEHLVQLLRQQFGEQLLYVGLQGSCRRGETTENSDIDAVVVLEELSIPHLQQYRDILCRLGQKEKSCGFICGRKELAGWNPLESCLMLHETLDLYGKLEELMPPYTQEDVRVYLKLNLGNLYHELCHRYLHSGQLEQELPRMYKSTLYLLQNLHWLRTGVYPMNTSELEACLCDTDRQILLTAAQYKQGEAVDAKEAFEQLFDWSAELLRQL